MKSRLMVFYLRGMILLKSRNNHKNKVAHLATLGGLFLLIQSCSTNIQLSSKFCEGEGLWNSKSENLDRRGLEGEQVFKEKEYFVFAGVGVKDLSYEELLEDLDVKCEEIKTFRLTTYSTWFESILSVIPLFRFRSLRVSGTFLKSDDAKLVESLNRERQDTSEKDTPKYIEDNTEGNSLLNTSEESGFPSELIDGNTSEETEYSEDDFEE